MSAPELVRASLGAVMITGARSPSSSPATLACHQATDGESRSVDERLGDELM